MPTGKEFEWVENNLRRAMQVYSRGNEAGSVHEMPGVTAVKCGHDYPLFNIAMLNGRVTGSEHELTRRIALPSLHFSTMRQGWSFWICEDLLDPSLRKLKRRAFSERGFVPIAEPPGMCATKIWPRQRKLPELSFQAVENSATRLAFCHLSSVVFDLPFPMAREIYDTPEAWRPDYVGFLGFFHDRPVTSAVISLGDGVCGLYSVATTPDYRGLGFGEATVRYAIEQARERFGIETCVLQSTLAGRRMYERMGFREVTRFTVYRSRERSQVQAS
jgi:ribosomal protein S18 acetylase RimI-like enzyme